MSFLLILFLSHFGLASVDVAFIEMRNPLGEIIELEPGDRFAHVAVSYKGRWLHADFDRGVEAVSQEELERLGPIKAVITVPVDLDPAEVEKLMGKPYDFQYSWSDDRIYNSELVAKLLKIPPTPMQFEAKIWSRIPVSARGQPGISPDEIFRALTRKASPSFPSARQCWRIFR